MGKGKRENLRDAIKLWQTNPSANALSLGQSILTREVEVLCVGKSDGFSRLAVVTGNFESVQNFPSTW